MTAVDVIRSAIADLPPHPDEIAAKMEAQGIKALMSCPKQCVMAEYFNQRLFAAGYSDTFVQNTLVHVADEGVTLSVSIDKAVTLAFPSYVRGFIDAFDDGKYPQLVDFDKERARSRQPFEFEFIDELEARYAAGEAHESD